MSAVIVFDLDGTLVDSRADLAASVAHALAAHDHPSRSFDEIVARVGQGARHLIERCLPDDARAEAEVDRVLGTFRSHYRDHLVDRTRPYPGIPEMLAALSRDHRLAVLTNKPGEMARAVCEGLRLSRFLGTVWGPDDAGVLKPDPGGLQAILESESGTLEESWYVGDMPLDIQTGRAAGVRTAAVLWGLGDARELEAARPDRQLRVVADLAALPDAR